jgi:3-oxoacyl-[acyl-carrier-protein] synthase-3
MAENLRYVDSTQSVCYANNPDNCQIYGRLYDRNGALKGWASFPQKEWLSESLFAVKQDTRLLSENIVPLGVEYLKQLSKKYNFQPEDVDWFLPHMSSMFFKDIILEESKNRGFFIPEDKWFYNLPLIGNIGSASAFAMIEELMNSGKLVKGQKVLVMIPESARFSYCYCMLTVC